MHKVGFPKKKKKLIIVEFKIIKYMLRLAASVV